MPGNPPNNANWFSHITVAVAAHKAKYTDPAVHGWVNAAGLAAQGAMGSGTQTNSSVNAGYTAAKSAALGAGASADEAEAIAQAASAAYAQALADGKSAAEALIEALAAAISACAGYALISALFGGPGLAVEIAELAAYGAASAAASGAATSGSATMTDGSLYPLLHGLGLC